MLLTCSSCLEHRLYTSHYVLTYPHLGYLRSWSPKKTKKKQRQPELTISDSAKILINPWNSEVRSPRRLCLMTVCQCWEKVVLITQDIWGWWLSTIQQIKWLIEWLKVTYKAIISPFSFFIISKFFLVVQSFDSVSYFFSRISESSYKLQVLEQMSQRWQLICLEDQMKNGGGEKK